MNQMHLIAAALRARRPAEPIPPVPPPDCVPKRRALCLECSLYEIAAPDLVLCTSCADQLFRAFGFRLAWHARLTELAKPWLDQEESDR